jgi:hypothetical protein
MKTDLHSRSSVMAQRAIRHFLDHEFDRFFILAAVAFELLAKARLTEIHPTLIAADKDFDALLHLAGAEKHATTPPWSIRTIGAGEALTRCLKVQPELGDVAKDLRLLADVRNSVVHLGAVPKTDARRVFGSFLRASGILLKELPLTAEAYFGEFEPVVKAHLDKTAATATQLVVERIAAAKAGFKARYGDLPKTQIEMILQAIHASIRVEKYAEVFAECPSCKQSGVARGLMDVRWDADVDREGNVEGVFPTAKLIPQEFKCPVCLLQLKGALELKAAGLHTPLPIPDIDPSDFLTPETEPEYDPPDFDPSDFDFDPGDFDPSDADPGFDPSDFDPGDVDPGDFDPGDRDQGDVDRGDHDPGDRDPGDRDPGDDDPGDDDPGDR